MTGNLCSDHGDYITIPDGGSTAGSNTNFARFCGGLLGNTAGDTSASTVITRLLPFSLGVNFDGTETDSPTELSKGFYIYYSQTPC